jgi:hypothetical protein
VGIYDADVGEAIGKVNSALDDLESGGMKGGRLVARGVWGYIAG